jgi:hypothetical protein
MHKLLRKILKAGYRSSVLVESLFDREFLAHDVPMSTIVSHQKWQQYLYELGNKPGMRILEVGSREVTGQSEARKAFAAATYVGFDFHPGENVDVVGDAPTSRVGRDST